MAVDLIRKINEFDQVFKKEAIDQESLGKIKKLLLAKNTPLRIEILRKYGVDKRDVITGVQCTICNIFAMQFKHGIWECPECHYRSRVAHLPAINDYFLIINPFITNSELREFLHIPTSRAATNVLQNLQLSNKGNTKDRVYFQK
jgi:hypothetical protein